MLPGLQGDRAELWQNVAGLRVGDRRDVADGVDLRVLRKPELFVDRESVAALEVEAERPDKLVPLQAGSPDKRVGREDRSGETDATTSPVITSTPRSASAFSVYERISGLNIAKISGEASTSTIRACWGSMSG
jgi:hypothetical protein